MQIGTDIAMEQGWLFFIWFLFKNIIKIKFSKIKKIKLELVQTGRFRFGPIRFFTIKTGKTYIFYLGFLMGL
jgi:hypothetical protein